MNEEVVGEDRIPLYVKTVGSDQWLARVITVRNVKIREGKEDESYTNERYGNERSRNTMVSLYVAIQWCI